MQSKRTKSPLHGFINLHKPLGITSADAVNKAKWLIKPTKIGHAGTLDPLATGVLPLALGEGTKCINLLMDAKKTYEFTVTFGERRATDDAEGEVIATSAHMPTEADILAIFPRFTGVISQTPPIYSALKVDGKRAYDLARAGEAVELAAREVTVFALEFLGFASAPHPKNAIHSTEQVVSQRSRFSTSPKGEVNGASVTCRETTQPFCLGGGARSITSPLGEVDAPDGPTASAPAYCASGEGLPSAHFRAVVSKGTYIRSLGRDIAQALGTEGYISHLHRSAVGPFTDENAISLDFLEKSVHNAPPPESHALWLTPLERALDDIPAVSIDGGQLVKLRQGQRILLIPPRPDSPQVAVLHQEKLVGLARTERGELIPTRLLNRDSSFDDS